MMNAPAADQRSTNNSPSLPAWQAVLLTLMVALHGTASSAAAQEPQDVYSTADPELAVVTIDSSESESFLAARSDTAGRLFVGGREALFVYEPDTSGQFLPRQELYRFPEHTWIYDIAIRGDDIYVSTVSALYVLPNARQQRSGLQARRLVWGIPLGHVHQCFHALAWGPEGDLYFSTGDPTWYLLDTDRPDHWGHWTYFSQPEGTRTPYNGVGGVFRVRPDGSNFRVVATGIRNACGMVFDSHWNLFANDNDHEGAPAQYVPGRLLHLFHGCDAGWPRGWMLHKTPNRRDLLRTMFGGMGRGVPVGQSYYDEALLPTRYRNNLLVARWGARMIGRYPLTRRGAEFQTDEFRVLEGQGLIRPVGVTVGPRGRVFGTISYMAHNESSPTYRSDLVMLAPKAQPQGLDYTPYETTQATPEKLYAELQTDSRFRRQAAHQEILRRGQSVTRLATDRLLDDRTDAPTDSGLIHLCHLAAAHQRPDAPAAIRRLLEHPQPMVRLQAWRALSEHAFLQGTEQDFAAALADPEPLIRLTGIRGLQRQSKVPREVLQTATSEDTALRQAATILLAKHASMEQLQQLLHADDPATRLAGILAAGRKLTIRPTFAELPEELPVGDIKGPEIQFDGESVDLRTLGRTGTYRISDWWKHVPHTDEQEQTFSLLLSALDDPDLVNRLQAATFLHFLNDKRSEQKVQSVRRDSVEAKLEEAEWHPIPKIWAVGPIVEERRSGSSEFFTTSHPVEHGPVDLSAQVQQTDEHVLTWQRLDAATDGEFWLDEELDVLDRSSVYVYFQLESNRKQRVHFRFGEKNQVKIWRNGEVVWKTPSWFRRSDRRNPQEYIAFNLHAGTNSVLMRVLTREGQPPLTTAVRSLETVYSTVPEPEDLEFQSRLQSASAGDVSVPAEFLQVDWQTAGSDGDPVRGKRLFQSLGCGKCHALNNDSSIGIGPSLAEARKRFTPAYLAESVLLPGKRISPAFKSTTIVTTSGKAVNGLVIKTTPDTVEIAISDGTRQTIRTEDIDEQVESSTSVMPGGLVKHPHELRDLISFLLSGG